MFRRLVSCILMISLVFSTVLWEVSASAAVVSMAQVYNYAKTGNLNALKQLKSSIETVDRYGNTAMCRSILMNDYSSFYVLKTAGASVNAPCVSRVSPERVEAFNKGYVSWAKGVNSGRIANPIAHSVKTATAGQTATPTSSSMYQASIAEETGLSTGTKVAIGVGAAVLVGGAIALASGGGGGGGEPPCPSGIYDANGNCVNGSICASGIYDDNGNCVQGAVNNGQIIINNDNDDDIYGMKDTTNQIMYNAYAYMDDSDTGVINIGITNTGNGNVFGMYGQNFMYNAYTYDESCSGAEYANAEIRVENVGNGYVYGMFAEKTSPAIYNGYICDNCPGGGSNGTIFLNNTGDGNVYGMMGNNVYNSFATGNKISKKSPVYGSISIENQGPGNVYGIYGRQNVYNALIDGTYQDRLSQIAAGTIVVSNTGSGNAYGMYNESDGIVSNESSDTFSSAIRVTVNGSGDAYGLYSNGGTVNNSGDITITNNGSGNIYGIYGTDNTKINNSGNLTLSNVNSDSYAYGIFAGQNATISNTGNITILGTSTDKAFGIKAGAGSTVVNSGKITLNSNTYEANTPVNNYIVIDGVQATQCGNNEYGVYPACQPCPANSTSPAGTTTINGCTCSGSLVMVDGQCIDLTTSCAENQYWGGSSCLACPGHSSSPAGTPSVSGCICDEGYAGADCNTCAPGFYLENGECMNETMQCAANQYWNGSGCSACPDNSTSPPKTTSIAGCVCNAGFILQNGACVEESRSCGANQYWNGSSCSACPSGSTSSAGTDSIRGCICGTGQILVNGRCVSAQDFWDDVTSFGETVGTAAGMTPVVEVSGAGQSATNTDVIDLENDPYFNIVSNDVSYSTPVPFSYTPYTKLYVGMDTYVRGSDYLKVGMKASAGAFVNNEGTVNVTHATLGMLALNQGSEALNSNTINLKASSDFAMNPSNILQGGYIKASDYLAGMLGSQGALITNDQDIYMTAINLEETTNLDGVNPKELFSFGMIVDTGATAINNGTIKADIQDSFFIQSLIVGMQLANSPTDVAEYMPTVVNAQNGVIDINATFTKGNTIAYEHTGFSYFLVGIDTRDTQGGIIRNEGLIDINVVENGYQGANLDVSGIRDEDGSVDLRVENTGTIQLTVDSENDKQLFVNGFELRSSGGNSIGVNSGNIFIDSKDTQGNNRGVSVGDAGFTNTQSGYIKITSNNSATTGVDLGIFGNKGLLNQGKVEINSKKETVNGIRSTQSSLIQNSGDISLTYAGTGDVMGIALLQASSYDTTDHRVINTGAISIDNQSKGTAYGIYAANAGGYGDMTVTNAGTIDISAQSGTNYGIYALNLSTGNMVVANTGTINITDPTGTNYGIYAVGEMTVQNSGTITLNGASLEGENANTGNYISLSGGASFSNAGLVQSSALGTFDSNDFFADGEGRFEMTNEGIIESESIRGDYVASLNLDGFQNVYTSQNAFQGKDAGINLTSSSYLFNASLNSTSETTHDIVMTMKSFEEVVDNKSLANFLTANYTAGMNESFFNELKSFESRHALTDALDSMSGLDTLTRFTHEDLTVMREVNLAMNDMMFTHNQDHMYEANGSLNVFGFRNDKGSNAQFALGNTQVSPRVKVGYAMSKTNMNTDDDQDTTRRNSLFQVFMPISYNRSGWQMIATPQLGYARAHYTRDGYQGKYEGIIEKRIFALMNEARYPITFHDLEVSPTLEFNAIAYNQKGSEDAKAFALTMPSDNNLSVEAGIGLRVRQTLGNLSLTSSIMGYREFADPYNVKLGMYGLNGTFNLYDDVQEYRGKASFGFNYKKGTLDMYGLINHYMQRDGYTTLKTGIKLNF